MAQMLEYRSQYQHVTMKPSVHNLKTACEWGPRRKLIAIVLLLATCPTAPILLHHRHQLAVSTCVIPSANLPDPEPELEPEPEATMIGARSVPMAIQDVDSAPILVPTIYRRTRSVDASHCLPDAKRKQGTPTLEP